MAKSNQWVKRIKVQSTTTSEVYTVAQKTDGSFGCSCKAWIFQRKRLPNGHCKHIQHALSVDVFASAKAAAVKENYPTTRVDALSSGMEFFVFDLEDRSDELVFVGAAPIPLYE
jgi:hypothetical protein